MAQATTTIAAVAIFIFNSRLILNVLFLIASSSHEAIDRAIVLLRSQLLLLALELQVLVMVLLLSDRAFLRHIIILVNDRVLVCRENVWGLVVCGKLVLEVAHLMVHRGWEHVGRIIRMCFIRILLWRCVNCILHSLLLLLLDALKIGLELFRYLVDPHIYVLEVLGAFVLRRSNWTLILNGYSARF